MNDDLISLVRTVAALKIGILKKGGDEWAI